ncbi:DUF2007 domain-containing protein [Leeuwenhoekiella sp. MAR_2009_132]|uniref:DUF2007 domain-containing protein n=1 Tax=Leeuwenhoekiella sp. MAR_2009_132 TaxID=1392489 RepID=UPI000569F317|nr:DUF2007 domain-containing protein [Leeuwenhoekiella sp. MAR_2009_132]
MIKESNYERVYTGSEINGKFIQNYLEEAGIHSVVRNDGESAIRAGFGTNYINQTLVFVEKENLVKAKHLVEKAFVNSEISDTDFEEQATQSSIEDEEFVTDTNSTLIQKEEKPKRSMLNLALNAGLLLYSLYRLYPLTQGETLPTFRIVLSGFIAVFCAYTLFKHFKN